MSDDPFRYDGDADEVIGKAAGFDLVVRPGVFADVEAPGPLLASVMNKCYHLGLKAGSARVEITMPDPTVISPEEAAEMRAHVRHAIDQRIDETLREAWRSYHALADAVGKCRLSSALDARCLGCAELERLARPKS